MSPICPFRYPPGRLLWLPLAACALWLALVFGLYRQALHAETAHRLELERTRLATVAQQLLDVRNWNAAHGGVYVRQSPYGPPNPWLPEEDRTLAVADGRTLVLMNPAYMSRQLAERVAEPGLRISIVSPHPLRPDNLADAWESGALARCTEGAREIFAPPQADGQGRLRLLSVLTAGQDCLRCHHDRAEGEILGGISVSQDATDFQRGLATQVRHMHLLYGLLGLTGVLSVGGASLYLTRRRWLAEETSRLKSALLARLGHDMRTPLSAMLGMAELLRRPDLRAPEKNRALDYLTQAGGALLEMVGDITDHAALEQAAPPLREIPFNLRACLEECLALYRPVAEAKGLFLRLEAAPDLPQTVTGDCFRLRQALGNLVSNAVKFTEKGGVTFGYKVSEDGNLYFYVRDTGSGIPAENLGSVFDRFVRLDKNVKGTGLGLSICSTIVEKLGGEIGVESEGGQGSTFWFTVPRSSGEEISEEQPSGEPVVEQPVAAKPKVLVADDTYSNYKLFEAMLKNDFEVMHADNGQQAVDMFSVSKPDIVLMDINMPVMNGYQALEEIRKLQGGDTVPVIAVTAYAFESDEQRILQNGFDAYVSKPVNGDVLKSKMNKLIATGVK